MLNRKAHGDYVTITAYKITSVGYIYNVEIKREGKYFNKKKKQSRLGQGER